MNRAAQDRIRSTRGEQRRRIAQAAREAVHAFRRGEDSDEILERLSGAISAVDSEGNRKGMQA